MRFLTHDHYVDMTTPLGLDLRPLGGDIRAMVADAPKASDSLLRRNPIAIYFYNRRNARKMAARWMRECLEACRDVDAIITTGSSVFLGVPVAEHLGLPFIQAYTQPSAPTRAFPSPFLLGRRWRMPGVVNLALHYAIGLVSWLSFQGAPFQSGQLFWGLRLCQLGIATPPISYRKLTVDSLATAIGQVTGNVEMARRAAEFAGAQPSELGSG